MASLVMASSVTISMSSSASLRPAFSSISSVRVVSTVSFPEPLRVFRGPSRSPSQSLYLAACRASPRGTQSIDLEEAVRHAIEEAEEVCAAEDVTREVCAEAWDEVEELAATVAHKKLSEKEKEDLLEASTREGSEASPQVAHSRTGLENIVQEAIEEAEEVCAAQETSPSCAEAWDEVEELAATVAHMKLADLEGSPGSNLL